MKASSILLATLAVIPSWNSLGATNEAGFMPLLDEVHISDWKALGRGGVKQERGAWTTWAENTPDGPRGGVFCYAAKKFDDFVLRLSFKADKGAANSGIFVRIPSPIESANLTEIPQKAYEVDIRGGSASDITGSILGFQTAAAVRQKPAGQWNELEISAVGQVYRISVNDKLVNEFKGDRDTSGFIGIQNHYTGPVLFRDIRIKELSPSVAQPVASPTVASPTVAEVSPLAALVQNAPNASAWVLAPLDKSIPVDIRQNLTFLREDLLDEGKIAPKANLDAYKFGYQLCSSLLAALDDRDKALSQAGLVAVQSDAKARITSQGLEGRKNYLLSWPQYARESDLRDELKRQATSNAAVMKEMSKVEWADRVARLRTSLDGLYAKYRDVLRQSSATLRNSKVETR